MTPAENLMQLADTYADAECDYRLCGEATSCQEEYASDQARAALVAAVDGLITERDALRKVVQAALDNLNPGYVVASASRIHKDMQAAMSQEKHDGT